MRKIALAAIVSSLGLVAACSGNSTGKEDASVGADSSGSQDGGRVNLDSAASPDTMASVDHTSAVAVDEGRAPDTARASTDTASTDTASASTDTAGTSTDTTSASADTAGSIDTAAGMDSSTSTPSSDASIASGCPSLAGAYRVTTDIVATTCGAEWLDLTTAAVYTFVQAAPSCSFTMTNSVYAGSVYSGHFVMAGSNAQVLWDSVNPAPSVLGNALTYTSESLTITPGATQAASTLVGSFAWQSAANCGGTTNVCNGSVTSCPTPQ